MKKVILLPLLMIIIGTVSLSVKATAQNTQSATSKTNNQVKTIPDSVFSRVKRTITEFDSLCLVLLKNKGKLETGEVIEKKDTVYINNNIEVRFTTGRRVLVFFKNMGLGVNYVSSFHDYDMKTLNRSVTISNGNKDIMYEEILDKETKRSLRSKENNNIDSAFFNQMAIFKEPIAAAIKEL